MLRDVGSLTLTALAAEVRDEPVVHEGLVVPGKQMSLTLSVDHRPVDGALAGRWMGVLVDLLEHPVRLLA